MVPEPLTEAGTRARLMFCYKPMFRDANVRATSRADVKPADVKPADVKPADVKPADLKPVDLKPAEVRQLLYASRCKASRTAFAEW